MSRRLFTGALAALLCAVVAAGCTTRNFTTSGCDPTAGDTTITTAILLAQAVPTAELIPCVDALPTGWGIMQSEIGSSGAVVAFHHDRAGERALVVRFAPSCDVTGASLVPSDEPGARRYELVTAVVEGYQGTRSYVYDGGCTTYDFRLPGPGWSAEVGDLTAALSFIPRPEVEELARALKPVAARP